MKLPAELTNIWAQKLKESGFVDIEYPDGRVKTPDRRTRNFENREMILDFFLALDKYLVSTYDIEPRKRKILELYSQGTRINLIAKEVARSTATVKNVIAHYRDIVLGRTSD